MKEIFKVEIKNNSVLLNGNQLTDEEVSTLIKDGLKYEAFKERFNFIQGASV